MPSAKLILAAIPAMLAVAVNGLNQINVYTYVAGSDCDNDSGTFYGYETYSYSNADQTFNAPVLPSGVVSYDILFEDIDGIDLPPTYACPADTAEGDYSNCYMIIGGAQSADSECKHIYNGPQIQLGSS